jgi:hypothetical protein
MHEIASHTVPVIRPNTSNTNPTSVAARASVNTRNLPLVPDQLGE